jgi:hypothetical protein
VSTPQCWSSRKNFSTGACSSRRSTYSSCSLGGSSERLQVSRAGIVWLVDVRQWREDEVVHVRYDLGKGHRAQLASREVIVDTRDGSQPRIGTIDSINLWGRVREDGYESLPARRAGLRPPDMVMDDSQLPPLPTGARPFLPARHYWAAAHVKTGHADRIWVKLPDLTVDGAPVAWPEIRFERRLSLALARR